MEADWFVVSLDAMERAADEARTALDAVVAVLGPVRHDRIAGVPLRANIERMEQIGGPAARRAAGLALQRYEQAVQSFRAEVIRHFVADEGLSLSEAARILGVSRQRAARIVAAAPDVAADSSPDLEDLPDTPFGRS